jgi:hypothetical protein
MATLQRSRSIPARMVYLTPLYSTKAFCAQIETPATITAATLFPQCRTPRRRWFRFTAVKKVALREHFALSETGHFRGLLALASVGPTVQRVGHTYGDEGKAASLADGFAMIRHRKFQIVCTRFA